MATEQRTADRATIGGDAAFRRATVLTVVLAVVLLVGLTVWDAFAPFAGHVFLAAVGFNNVAFGAVAYHAWFAASWAPGIAACSFLALGLLVIWSLREHTAKARSGQVNMAAFRWAAIVTTLGVAAGHCAWQYHQAQAAGQQIHSLVEPTQSTVDDISGQARMQLSLWTGVSFREAGRSVSFGKDLVLAYGEDGRYLYDLATGRSYAPDSNSVSYTGGPQF